MRLHVLHVAQLQPLQGWVLLGLCFNEIVMVVLGWYLFYIVVLILEIVTALSHNRDLNYYDGSRGRMDRNYDTHDEFFQRNNRPKRTPHSPNLWAISSESQGVSCPTRPRENSLDTLGDTDRMEEVVHIACPKRKSSGAKVVASFKGKSMKCRAEKSHKGDRGARELFKKNTRGNDLNHAVRQNAQWLILSSQDRIQKPNQGQSFMSADQTGQNWNANQPLPNGNQGMPILDRPAIWTNPKGSKEERRKTQYSKSAQFAPKSTDGQLKPKFQAPHSNNNAPPIPRLKDTVLSENEQQFSAAPNQGYIDIGPVHSVQQPPRNVQVQLLHPQVVPNQGAFPKKDRPLQTPYEGNRLLMNSYDGLHHNGPQNQPSNNYSSLSTTAQLAYPKPDQMNPSFFQSQVTPVNEVQQYSYNIVYNVTMPSATPKMFPSMNETRNGPWAPGALEVDVPPGYPHQPTLPKTTTRSFDAVNIKDLPKADQKIPGSTSQPTYPKYRGQGVQNQYRPFPNERPQQESWKYHDGPHRNYQYQQNPNVARQEPPVGSYGKPGVAPFLEKTTQAYKGVFGKLKKDDSKVKLVKPAKIPAGNAHARLPSVDGEGSPLSSYGGNVIPVAKPDESAPLLPQQELRPRLQNSLARNEATHYNAVAKVPNSKAVVPLRKTSHDRMSLDRGQPKYHNISGDMSHILNPPVTMDTRLYTNKAHKIASKFVSSEDVTYVPFRGVPPARNDEDFYDKNLNFLGKIERPPLVNIKKRKWSKLNRHFNADRVCKRLHADVDGFHSKPVYFHGDTSAEDFRSEHEPKPVDRHSRKCHHDHGHDRKRFNSHSRTKA